MSNEGKVDAPAVPQDMRLVPVWLLERVEQSLGSFTSDEGWSQSDMDTMDSVSAMIAATLAPAPAQERCSTCGYLTSEREHLGCLRRAVKDLDIATGGPYDAQGVGLTDEEIEAIAKATGATHDN